MTRLTDCDLEQLYCEFLDEIYGTVKIAGLEYETSSALKEIDPTAFRCGFNDWLDAELGETIWEKDGEYFNSDPDADDAKDTDNE